MYTIYRIEHPTNGYGPYQSKISGFCYSKHPVMRKHDEQDPTRPIVRDFIEPDEYCGFLSLQDLHRWFKGCLYDLFVAGFKIVKYEVSDYFAPDDYQVLFRQQGRSS